jgi:hypothetical protein
MNDFKQTLKDAWAGIKQNPEYATTPLGAMLGLVIARKTKDPDDETVTPELLGAAAGGGLGYGVGRLMKGTGFAQPPAPPAPPPKPFSPAPLPPGDLGGEKPKLEDLPYQMFDADVKLPDPATFDAAIEVYLKDPNAFIKQPWVMKMREANPKLFNDTLFNLNFIATNQPETLPAFKKFLYKLIKAAIKPTPPPPPTVDPQ